MVQHDPKNYSRTHQVIDPDGHTSGANALTLSVGVNSIGFRYAEVIVNVGASAGVWALQLQSSATLGGTYADMVGALISVGTGSDDTRLNGFVDLHGAAANNGQNFLKLQGISTTGTIELSATIKLYAPKDSPQYIDHVSGGVDEPSFDV